MLKTIASTTAALAAVALLAACSGTGSSHRLALKTPATTTAGSSAVPLCDQPGADRQSLGCDNTTRADEPEPTADPNTAACTKAHEVILRIQATFNGWDPDTDEFDPTVAEALRDEATDLYGVARDATGGTAEALRDEAAGMTRISVAIEAMDDVDLQAAATDANTALAAVRGVCGF